MPLVQAEEWDVWIGMFITGLGIVPSIAGLIDLDCDNKGVIPQAKEPRSH